MRNLRELTRVLGRRNAVFGENTRFVSTTQTDIHAADGSLGIAKGRRAIIYSPSKTPMQSGVAQTLAGNAPAWKISLDTEGKWINPLMGWTSTADTSETVTRQMYFKTKDEAIAFAEKAGLEYKVEEPAEVPRYRPKRYPGYGSNFDVNRLPGGTPRGGLRSEQGGKK
ncbi:hypothetical protein Ndes2526B_g05113 [Nannochloris sp. 'desiccata']